MYQLCYQARMFWKEFSLETFIFPQGEPDIFQRGGIKWIPIGMILKVRDKKKFNILERVKKRLWQKIV